MPPRAALFIPCFVDQLYPQVGLDTVHVLRKTGCDVDFPAGQTCCGQPAFNTGYWEDACPVAANFVRIFNSAEAVVCPSGSCTTMVRSVYPKLLAESPLRDEAASVKFRMISAAVIRRRRTSRH